MGVKSDVVGLPFKLNPRVDFEIARFEKLVERSPRFVWERSALCPCANNNTQTQQADVTCVLCGGAGFFWFGPNGYVVDEDVVGALTQTQKSVQARNDGAIIRGFMASAQMMQTGYDRLGGWFWGQMRITVRPENKLGYYDRLINLDESIVFTETLEVDGAATTQLRYPAIDVYELRTLTSRFICGVHYDVVDGDISWLGGQEPDADTRIAVHYLCHPAWIVINFPHVERASTTRSKTRTAAGQPSPPPVPQSLPIHADVKLEFEREG